MDLHGMSNIMANMSLKIVLGMIKFVEKGTLCELGFGLFCMGVEVKLGDKKIMVQLKETGQGNEWRK